MSQWAIVTENLGKSYRISDREYCGTFLERGRAWLSGRRKAGESRDVDFWALRNVSFEVGVGERLGVLGANGAGKSTLLKILSRVTAPTEGRAYLRGRVASLLEVGTGFHPELTGRENIFLNGAVLGLSRNDIRKSFDSIVDYSGVEKFIDTPIKHYSSGMHVRLAFAVAAHIDPDILILDEVLTVGDAAFQKKSRKHIDQAAKEGRTIILVSHSMESIRKMCDQAILLDHGTVSSIGSVDNTIDAYSDDAEAGNLERPISFGRIQLAEWKSRSDGNLGARITWAEIYPDQDERLHQRMRVGSDLLVRFGAHFDQERRGSAIKASLVLAASDGLPIANMINEDSNCVIESAGENITVSIVLKDLRLYPGRYKLSIWLGSIASQTWDFLHDCLVFDVAEGGELARRSLPREAGLLFLTPEWRVD